MKLEPVTKWITGRALLTKKDSVLFTPDQSKGNTRCYYIEEVGPDAEKAGYKPGDFVVARLAHDMIFREGSYHRVALSLDEIICRVRGVSLQEFVDIKGNPIVLDGNKPAEASAS